MASRRAAFALACALAIVLSGGAGARAAEPDPAASDRIVLSGDLDVPRGTQAGEIVVVSGDVTVGGVARGDVVVLSGHILVTGHVSGDVIAIHGDVAVGPDAQVRGNVLARGRITVEPGATIDGTVSERTAFTWQTPVDVFGGYASWLAVSVSALLLGLGLVLIVPRGLDTVARVARTSSLLSAVWAVAIVVAVPIAAILFAASLVALPLGLVMLLGAGLVLFVGYVASAYALGRALWSDPRNRAASFAIGWLILRAVAAIPYLGGVTFLLGAAFGTGAIGVAAWRARDTGGRHRERRVTIRLDDVAKQEAGL
jgi:cytoskeletal protein CcmA (bactofilin family)